MQVFLDSHQHGIISQGPLPSSVPLMSRFAGPADDPEAQKRMDTLAAISRGEFDGDANEVLAQFALTMQTMSRGIYSGTPNLPIRENLEAEVQVLMPRDTPVRNRLRRVPGAGTAVKFRQLVTMGGGWGAPAGVAQLGGGSVARMFFGESGAPATVSSTYANQTFSYKLMGVMGEITGFSMAAGANFMNQFQTERTNSILNLMLNEEYALISGDSTSTVAPWGDGTNALAFDGLINLTSTAYGVPSAQIQTGVGALTTAHIDSQIKRIWDNGGRNIWMLMSSQEVNSLVHLAEASGSLIRIQAGQNNKVDLGVHVGGYIHAITGERIDIVVARFMPAGTILYIADTNDIGQPSLEVEVLPQVQLPELAPNTMVQGYVAQEIAPSPNSPQVFRWLVSSYQVPKLKNAYMVAKSTGVTAV